MSGEWRSSAARIDPRRQAKIPAFHEAGRDGGDERGGHAGVGLLDEPEDRGGRAARVGDARDDVPVARLGPRGADPERDERGGHARGTPRGGRGGREDGPEPGLVRHEVVGGKDEHDVVVGAVDRDRGERDRRGRVPPGGLAEDVPCGEVRQLLPDEIGVAPVRHDVHVARRHEAGRAGRPSGAGATAPPSGARNGFGRSGRERGQSRVPPPPARTTA